MSYAFKTKTARYELPHDAPEVQAAQALLDNVLELGQASIVQPLSFLYDRYDYNVVRLLPDEAAPEALFIAVCQGYVESVVDQLWVMRDPVQPGWPELLLARYFKLCTTLKKVTAKRWVKLVVDVRQYLDRCEEEAAEELGLAADAQSSRQQDQPLH